MTGIQRCIMEDRAKRINEKAVKQGFITAYDVLKALFPECCEDPVDDFILQMEASDVGWIVKEP